MSDAASVCAVRGHRSWRVVRQSLAADIRRFQHKSPENQARGDSLRTRLGALATPQLMCLVIHRVAHLMHARGWCRTSRFLSGVNLYLFKVTITPGSCIGPGCFLPHPGGVTFHGTAGVHATIYTQSTCVPMDHGLGLPVERGPRLGDRVTVGATSVVIGAVSVGDDTRIGPGSVVDRDAPAGVLVVSTRMRTEITPRPM